MEQSCKGHYTRHLIARGAIRDAHNLPVRTCFFDLPMRCRRRGEEPAATVHDKDFVASVRQRNDLTRQIAHHGFVFE